MSNVPKLRFSEFRGANDWEEITLVKLATFRRGSFPQPYGLPEWYDDENGVPFVQVFDVSDDMRLKATTKRKISAAAAEKSIFIAKGTLIVTIQGSIGRVAITQYDAYIDRTLLLFKSFYKPTELFFLSYVIQNLFEIEKKKAPGGIIKTITKEVLSSFLVKLPSLQEQQKIANCLSSIDTLITAQTQKLDTLKAHKKGLMQQLFPATGETIPKRRFPEFRDAGDWEEKVLGDVMKFTGGGTPSKSNTSYWGGDNPWISSSDISEESIFNLNIHKYISEKAIQESATKIVPANSILLVSRVGVGKLAITNQQICTSQDFTNLTPVFDDLIFMAYLLKTKTSVFFAFNQGMAIKGFTKDDVVTLRILLPIKEEQQKVANCLSSIDDLITAQTQKIESLKAHKKGLMQQLFPASEEMA